MKKLLFPLAMLCIALALTSASCKKDQNDPLPIEDPKDTTEGLICEVGKPVGDEVSQTIGAAGGTIASENGALKVIVPAGAVSGNRNFALQTIENTLPSGIGFGFRLTPHGEQFAKPVKIQFSYKDNPQIQGENVCIAFQDAKGIWQRINKTQRDTVAKTVTIETTHFSDWSAFSNLALDPNNPTININESITLRAIEFTDDDLNVPLEKETQPVTRKAAKGVSNWQLGGAGVLRPNGSEAVYISPSTVPPVNPVAVSCQVAGKSLKLLVANIYIGGEGIFFKIDNEKEWTRATSPLGGIFQSGWTILQGSPTNQPSSAFSLSFLGDIAITDNWHQDRTSFVYSLPNHQQYNMTYMVGHNLYISPGTITIHKYGKVGEYITGSFLLEKAGFWDTKLQFPFVRTAKIEGYFNIKRRS
jgi:hypothetical protein